MPNTSISSRPAGVHVAIIMDGNGRWATARGRPRTAGHVVGARTARDIVEVAQRQGVGTLTLYAFSGDNWQRPRREVSGLMRLFRRTILAEQERCIQRGLRLSFIGRRDRLPRELLLTIESVEAATAHCATMHLRVALDYASRDTIVRAAERAAAEGGPLTRERFTALMGAADHSGSTVPDVDLLIRTGGEQRLSDFLLWECAYAELYFTRRMWPDFGEEDLAAAMEEFRARQRRFGAVDDDGEARKIRSA
ncbi:MAG: di-trans,poly-cis-decaprenylcistransferase [Gemmatimonadetes bacterium]|nr:di-trans,poly-cis-decaprenylcistransferase [Gemmatimonadota bacterium]